MTNGVKYVCFVVVRKICQEMLGDVRRCTFLLPKVNDGRSHSRLRFMKKCVGTQFKVGPPFVFIYLIKKCVDESTHCHHSLTCWGRLVHICVSDPTLFHKVVCELYTSKNIAWNNDDDGLLGGNFSQILLKCGRFSFKKMDLAMMAQYRHLIVYPYVLKPVH